jgi:hypothetical protein
MRKRVEVGDIKLQTRVVQQDSNNDRDAEVKKTKRGLARMQSDKDSTKTRDGKWIWGRNDWIIAHGTVGQLVILDKAVDKMIRGKGTKTKTQGALLRFCWLAGICMRNGVNSAYAAIPPLSFQSRESYDPLSKNRLRMR